MLTDDMKDTATETVEAFVDLVASAKERGLGDVLAACTMIGALKAVIRDLGPDRERVARYAAFEFEMLAEGEPPADQPRN